MQSKWGVVPFALAVGLVGVGAFALISGRIRIETTPENPERESAGSAEGVGEAKRSHVESGGVVLSDEEVRLAGIRTKAAATASVGITLSVPGEVRMADGRWARLTARLAGVLGDVRVAVGDEVASGDVLATVKAPELGEASAARVDAVAELALAQRNEDRWKDLSLAGFASTKAGPVSAGWVELDQALADLDTASAEESLAGRTESRSQDLFDKGIKSQSDLMSAEQDHARAKIRRDGARRRLDVLGVSAATEVERASRKAEASADRLRVLGLGDPEIQALSAPGARSGSGLLPLRSPIAGVVIERDATSGESVAADKSVFLVADLSVVWVQVSLYERDAGRVGEGMPVVVRAAAYPTRVFEGRVARLAASIDERTRTLGLRVEIENGAATDAKRPLRPGMFVTADVEFGRRDGVLVVPESAIQKVGGEDAVFVIDDDQPGPGTATADRPAAREAGSEDAKEAPKNGARGSMDDDERPAAMKDKGAGKSEGGKEGKPAADSDRKTRFESRRVRLGARDGKFVEVLSGIRAGDLVVVEGASLLKGEIAKSQFVDED